MRSEIQKTGGPLGHGHTLDRRSQGFLRSRILKDPGSSAANAADRASSIHKMKSDAKEPSKYPSYPGQSWTPKAGPTCAPVDKNPLTRGEKVIAHVLASNNAPRGLIERALRFQLVRRDSYPSKDLPGLPVNAQGMVEGDLFTMTNDSLRALAEWCTPAPATLRDGRPLNIELGNEHSFEIFAAALSQMSM